MPSARRLAVVFLAVFLWTDLFSITVAQAALTLSAALWAWSLWTGEPRPPLELPLLTPFLLFAAVSLVSVLGSEDWWRSLRGAKSLLLIGIVFLAANLVTSERLARRLLFGLLAAAVAASLLGLTQTYMRGVSYRVRGTLSIYMTLAGVLMVALLLALACVVALRGRDRLIPALAAIPITAVFLLTYTRNAWLGFLLGAVLVGASVARRWAITTVAVVVVVPLLAVALVEPVGVRIRSMADLSDPTLIERLNMWRSGLHMIRDHPLLGVGIKMPERAYAAYRDPERPPERIAHLHNDVLQIAAERGILGLAAWLAIWIWFFVRHARLRPRNGVMSPVTQVAWSWSRAVVAAVLVGGVFQYNFGDSEIIMLIYFAMGLAFGLGRPAEASGAVPALVPDGARERRPA